RVLFLPPGLLPEPHPDAIVGVPRYMAPELLTGNRFNATASVDVWGLGIMLYEMLTGRTPFAGATGLDVILASAQEEPTSPRSVEPGLDGDLDRITMQCLRKNPAERYASAADLADALDCWLRGERSPPRQSFAQRLRGWISGR